MTTTEDGATVMRGRTIVAASVALVALALASLAHAAPRHFVVEPEQSRVTYVSGTQLGEFRGSSGTVSGAIVLDPAEPSRLTLTVTVELRTVRSDNAKRDENMWSELLDTARFPATVFTATELRPGLNAARDVTRAAYATASAHGTPVHGTLVGTLKLHGVERPVSVPVRFVVDGATLQGDGSFTINLTDFGMTPPRLLGLKVRDQVTVEVRLAGVAR